MNSFFLAYNKNYNIKLTISIILITIGLFLGFTAIHEKDVEKIYYDNIYYNKTLMKKDVDYAINNDFSKNDIATEKENALSKLNIYNSFISKNQYFFLKAENDIKYLNQELSDTFHNLDYNRFHDGKSSVNSYLLKKQLPLKSIKYNTDSAIFTMNILEFLNSPIFFMCFFLITPITYLKKYSDGRIYFLLTQPLSRTSIIFKDFQLFIKNSGIIFLFVVLVSVLLSYFYSRTLTLDYPILITLLGKTTIVSLYKYLLILTFSFFFIGSFLFLLVYSCTLLTKKAIASIFIASFLCIFLNGIINQYENILNGLNPFSYVDVESLVKNTKKEYKIEYITQTDRNIDPQKDLSTGFVIENPYYYANDSLANRNPTIDIVLLPIVLLFFCIILLLYNIFLLNRF